jgi:hypothetical protein
MHGFHVETTIRTFFTLTTSDRITDLPNYRKTEPKAAAAAETA